jgi:hypothetical protein
MLETKEDIQLVFQEKFVTAYIRNDLNALQLVWNGNLSREDYIDS